MVAEHWPSRRPPRHLSQSCTSRDKIIVRVIVAQRASFLLAKLQTWRMQGHPGNEIDRQDSHAGCP